LVPHVAGAVLFLQFVCAEHYLLDHSESVQRAKMAENLPKQVLKEQGRMQDKRVEVWQQVVRPA